MTAKPGRPDPESSPQATAIKLLALTAEVVKELHPHIRGEREVALDDSLEGDLGFDSLGRVELLFRLEDAFGVSLPDSVLAGAETPRDLLRAVAGAEGKAGQTDSTAIDQISLAPAQSAPTGAGTLLDALDWRVRADPERLHVSFYGEGGETDPMSYGELAAQAERVAAGLQASGLHPGEAVAIMLPTGRKYFYAFYGALMAGGIPAPIYPPFRASQIEDHLQRHTAILANSLAPILITVPEAHRVSHWLSAQVPSLRRVASVEELQGEGAALSRPKATPGDIALLQYTSGSTGNPKGVVLTHQNLLANIRAMGAAVEVNSEDVFVSWLPLYHDMGLIGACLATMYHAIPVVLMSPLTFMSRPERWLWAIHRHRATLSGGVNYAYELCVGKIRERNLEGLDLSSWRFAFNGAEPISPETMTAFQERFAAYGLARTAMAPVYGLAECSVGLAFPPINREPLLDRVARERFLRDGMAQPAEPDDAEALRFVACGQPLTGHQIKIVDEGGEEVAERKRGRLLFKGPSATSGYFRNPEATRELFRGEWVDSGDVAYMADGDVYITSRMKDIIIRAGRKLHPYELEDAVGNLPAVRKGNVAVFGSSKGGEGTERLVVVAESRTREPAKRDELQRQIEELSMSLVGAAPDDIVLAPPHTVLKTSSGKIRRAAVRELYEKGLIDSQRRGWPRPLRLAVGLLLPQVRSLRAHVASRLYGVYTYLVLGAVTLVAWPLVALMPRPAWAWAIARRASRAILWLARVPVRVQGLENLSGTGPFVVVSNHSSYLDSLVLAAVLPVNLCYVAKGEVASSWIARIFIRRLGGELVDRFDSQRGVEDAGRLGERLRHGDSLMLFPEGTFSRMPGLNAFHMGAFTAAAGALAPVVAVSLRGTRSLLRDETWLPRRSAVTVSVASPLLPEGAGWANAVKLRDAARAAVLLHCGEPDLAAQGEAPGFLRPPGEGTQQD